MAGEVQHTIRWGNPGTTQWGTAFIERATAWEGLFAADTTNWTDNGTFVIFSGSAFRGSYVDAYGGTDSYYRFRFGDGTHYSDWSDPLWAYAPRAFCSVRDLRRTCQSVWDWFPANPAGTELETMYDAMAGATERIEAELDPNYPVPIQAGTDGRYDAPLVHAAANLAVWKLALWRYAGREMPDQFTEYRDTAAETVDKLKLGKMSLKYLVTPDEVGFTPPLASAGNAGDGVLEVDFSADFNARKRVPFVVEVTTSGAFHSALFRVSEDGGISWVVSGNTCGSDWQGWGNYGVPLRFRGSDEDDLYDFVSGDSWSFLGVSDPRGCEVRSDRQSGDNQRLKLKVNGRQAATLKRNLDLLAGHSRDRTPYFRKAGAYIEHKSVENFGKQSDPDGHPWKQLSPATLEARKRKGFGGDRILQVRADLKNSIGIIEVWKNGVRVGPASGLEQGKGRTHQYGRPAMAGWPPIPDRPFMGFDSAGKQEKYLMNDLVHHVFRGVKNG